MHYPPNMDRPDDYDDIEENDMMIEETDQFDPDNMCKYNPEIVALVHLKVFEINISYDWYIIF